MWSADGHLVLPQGLLLQAAHTLAAEWEVRAQGVWSLHAGTVGRAEDSLYWLLSAVSFQAVGTDRNIADQLLEHRANLLSSLLKFFHRDLQSLHDQYAQPTHEPSRNLCEKLYHIFETYLPMLQHNGNTFQNVPKLRMPKVMKCALHHHFILTLYNPLLLDR